MKRCKQHGIGNIKQTEPLLKSEVQRQMDLTEKDHAYGARFELHYDSGQSVKEDVGDGDELLILLRKTIP
jgi:hypothetical protein